MINEYINVLQLVNETFNNIDLKCKCDGERNIYNDNVYTFTINEMHDFNYTLSFYYDNYFKCDINMCSPRANYRVTITDIVYNTIIVDYNTQFNHIIKNDNYILDIVNYIIDFCDNTDY